MSIDDAEAPRRSVLKAPEDTSYTHGPPEGGGGGVLTIDLSAIETNWKDSFVRNAGRMRRLVKGDGYGCGLEPVLAQLYHAGFTTFFVADLSEGKRTRSSRGSDRLFLNRLAPGTGPVFAEHSLQPVIGSTSEPPNGTRSVPAAGMAASPSMSIPA